MEELLEVIKVEKKLAIEYIKGRKKKNIISVITIILITAFLMAVSVYAYSYNEMNKKYFKAFDGGYHGISLDINNSDLDKIKNHNNVEAVGLRNIGYFENNMDSDIEYAYYDSKALSFYDLNVVEGTYTNKKDEIAIDRLYMEKFNKNIGDKIKFLDKEFIITGIIDNRSYKVEDINFYRVFISEELAKELGGKTEGLIKLLKVETYEEDFSNIRSLLNIEEDRLVNNEGGIAASIIGAEIIPYIMIGLLVIISGIFIIYNIFNIMLVERVKAIGLLLTVGFTRKQIKKMVLWEALILTIVSIPIGIILGLGSAKLLMITVKMEGDLRFLVNPLIVLGVITDIITIGTVIISVMLPAIKISKLSPIEGTRFINFEEKNLKKNIKGKNFIDSIAKGNKEKNKKTNRITMISMILSITLFIVAAAIFKSMSIENMTQNIFIENVQVDLEFGEIFNESFITEDILNEVKNIKDIGSVTGLKVIPTKKDEVVKETLVGINDKMLKRAKEKIALGEIDEEAFKNGEGILVPMSHNESPYEIGEMIKLKDKLGNEKEVKVIGIIKEPIVNVGQRSIYAYNDSKIFENTNEYAKILIEAKKNESKLIAEKVENITKKYKILDAPQNFEDKFKEFKEEKKSIESLGYVIIGVIAIIGLMNFINSTLSEILFRRKEFGMLRGVGVTDTQIRKIIERESFLKLKTSVIGGVIGGNLLAFITVYIYKNFMGATFAVYTIPVIETIICIIIIFITLKIVTFIAIKKIVKDSIIEQIKIED